MSKDPNGFSQISSIILTFVWTVNFTLSLSLSASEISTTKEVSVWRSTVSDRLYKNTSASETDFQAITTLGKSP